MMRGITSEGIDIYKKETATGARVFTLQAARKYNLDTLQLVIDYMLETKKLDHTRNEKDVYSFGNVMKAMKEKAAPPTEEKLEAAGKIYEEIQKKHQRLGEVFKEEME